MLLESLEQRVVLTGTPMLLAPIDGYLGTESTNQQAALTLIQAEGEGTMVTSQLTIFANGQRVAIPANIGVKANSSTATVFTDTANGTLQSMSAASATLGDFFDIWRTDAGLAGNNANAVLSPTRLLTNVADTSHTVQMFVNGQLSDEFGDHELQNGEQIILVYSDNPVVSLNTNFGSIVIELFEDETPGTVNNFLNYVNDGDYINSFFHRSADSAGQDFVIQGGGFRTTSTTFTSTAQFSSVPTDAPIQNEPGISNVRGTVAMAKTSDPNSATSQFFVNLNDANTFLDDPNNSGGFTVFGQVLDLRTSDAIAALPTRANPSPYGELPVSTSNQLAVIQSIFGQGEITGTRFNDANRNGTRETGETASVGATIYLDANNNGALDPGEVSTVTDANGRYLFQVEPGSYTVRTQLGATSMLTLPTSSDSYSATVQIGRGITNRDFGVAQNGDTTGTGNNSLSGFAYIDADGNGIRNTGEIGVPGAQITLTGEGVTRTILTDSNGAYSFGELPDGTYQLVERQPTALLDSTDSTTVANAVVGNDRITAITLAGGQTLAENNFGEMGIQSQFLSIVWFFASSDSPDTILRETIADGEAVAGNPALAATIRSRGTEVPDGTNSAPIANDNAFTVNANGVLNVAVASSVLNNDTDIDGDSLTAVVVTQPTHGTLNFNGNGSFTYTPTTTFSGSDSFTYQASDGTKLSNQATVTITVNAVAGANVFSLNENSPAGTVVGTLTPEGELGSNVVFEIDNPTLNPLLELSPSDHLEGNPAGSVVLIEYMDLSCPHCRDIHSVVEQLETDFPGELLVVRRHLLLFNTSTNNFAFPNSLAAARVAEAAARQGMFDGMVDLLFTHQDDWRSASDPSTFFNQYAQQLGLNLTQFASDQADPAITARIQRDRDAAASLGITGTPSFYINGQATPNPGTITEFTPLIQNAVNASNNVFRLNRQTGQITVRNSAALDFETTPRFTLTVNATGQNGSASTTTATINLIDVNESAPVAVADSYSVDANAALNISSSLGVLHNDTDADGDSLTAQQVTAPTNGTLTLNASGSFTYTPNANFVGTDSFTYRASDGTRTSAAATVTIAVNTVNAAPLTEVDSYTLQEDGSLTVTAANGVLLNDSDPEGASLTAVLVDAPDHGTLSLNADGSFTYTPEANFSAADAFTYAASDGQRTSGPTTVTLLVQGVEDMPVAVNDSYFVTPGGTLNVTTANGLLANDTDADADPLTAVLLTSPANGTLTLNGNGSFSYQPNASFVGTDSFTYQANDGFFASNTATVTISVTSADLVRVRLEATNSAGTPIDSIGVGEAFMVNAFVEDIRSMPRGVFASYFDVTYNSNMASVTGPINYSTAFANGRSGSTATAGLIDEAGAFTQSVLGGGEALLFRVPFVANAAGTLNLAIDAADVFPAHDTLLIGINTAIPIAQIDFVPDSLVVTAPASGEGEASGLAEYAASADAAFAAQDDWLR